MSHGEVREEVIQQGRNECLFINHRKGKAALSTEVKDLEPLCSGPPGGVESKVALGKQGY